MLNWWSNLSLPGQVFAAVAIPATAVMLLQTLMLLFGFGLDADVDGDGVPDADVDHDGLGLISIRGIVAFFSVGGWAGFVADAGNLPVAVSALIALTAGFLALMGIGLLFRSFYKLQDSGNYSIDNAVGKSGRVYLTVPPKGSGQGKINLLLQERLVELDAVNEGEETLPTGEIVEVLSVADAQTVVVRSCHKEKTKNGGGISKWN